MWNATSSISTVEPRGRVPPTDGKMPERIFQYLEYSSGLSVKYAGLNKSNGLRISIISLIFFCNSSGVSAFVSVSTAVSPSPVGSLTAESV